MKTTFLLLFVAISLSFTNGGVKKTKWEGTWLCYSIINEGKLNGTLEIKRKGGKKYAWKYSYQNDQHLFKDPECPLIELQGTAVDNGLDELISKTKGIKFVYLPEDDRINVYQDFSDAELSKQTLCFGGDLVRKK